MNQMTSDGDDCGLDGAPDDLIKVAQMNRLIRRLNHAHIIPLHRQVDEHKQWIDKAEILAAKFEGGVAVAKRLAYLMAATVVTTFGLTLYMFREFERLMK